MPRDRSYRRRYIHRPDAGSAAVRLLAVLGVVAALYLVIKAVVSFIQRHPVWSILIAVAVVALAVLVVWAALRARAEDLAREAELSRCIEVTDDMT